MAGCPLRKSFLGLAAAAGACLAAPDGARTVLYRDAIVAVVDGEPITGHQVQEEIGSGALAGGSPAADTLKEREAVLERMIEQEVLYREFEDLKGRIPAQMVQDRLDRMVLRQANGSQERFEDLLFENGMTVSEIKRRIARSLAAEMLLYDRVQRDIQVSEPEIQAYYREHPGEFRRKPRFRLAVIRLRKDGRHAGRLPETWQEIRTALEQGRPFAELAAKYSEDSTALRGGDMGWQEDLNEELMAIVEHMSKGQVAPRILAMSQGEYLIRLADRTEGGLRPLEGEVRDRIRSRLHAVKEERRRREYLAPLYRKYNVRRF